MEQAIEQAVQRQANTNAMRMAALEETLLKMADKDSPAESGKAAVRYEFKADGGRVIEASYLVPLSSTGGSATGQYWVPLNKSGQFSFRLVDDANVCASSSWTVLAYLG